MSNGRIEGIAVVTGGASGMGADCCRELAALGAGVVVLDRDAAQANAVAAEVGRLRLERRCRGRGGD